MLARVGFSSPLLTFLPSCKRVTLFSVFCGEKSSHLMGENDFFALFIFAGVTPTTKFFFRC